MSDDLAAFVAARLDEDEAAARDWQPDPQYDEPGEMGVRWYKVPTYTPARVLREVELHRDVLSHYRTVADWGPGNWPMTLRLLAAIWSDHPDYDTRWAPAARDLTREAERL